MVSTDERFRGYVLTCLIMLSVCAQPFKTIDMYFMHEALSVPLDRKDGAVKRVKYGEEAPT